MNVRPGFTGRALLTALPLLLLLAPAAGAQFPAEVRGRVVRADDGAPVVGAAVEVSGTALRATTGADGAFHLRGVVPGPRELRVRSLGHYPRRVEFTAQNGRVTTLTVELAPDPVELEGVVAHGVPAAEAGATVIPRERIERSSARDVAQLLQDQPGVTVTRRGGPGSPATLSIRGSSADEVLVLVDGTPLNSPLTGEADFSLLPLEVVERVTLLRGAQSARYGPRALAGVVLIETRRPASGELAVRTSAGAWGERGAAVTAGHRAPLLGLHWSGLLSGEGRVVRGNFDYRVPRVRGGGVARRGNADVRLLSALAQGTLETSSGAGLRLRAEGLRVERGMPGSIVQPALEARQEQERRSLGLGGSGRWRGAGWRLDLDAQEQDASFRDPAPPFGPAYDERVRVESQGGTTSGNVQVRGVALSLGMEARRLEVASSMLASGAPRQQRLTGVWVQGQSSRGLGGGWAGELQAALRADHSSLLDETTLSPRVGAALSRPRLTARVSLGDAFSPPSLADQFFQEGVLARPNPDLRPERVRGEVELGLQARGLEAGPVRVDAEVAVHRADVDGMILWFPDHRFVWQPSNFDVRRRGWEASVQARFPRLAAELRGSASGVAVEYAGESLSGQVRYRPGLTADVTAAAGALGVRAELSGRFVGRRRTVAGTDLNALPAYWLSDLRILRPVRAGRWQGELSASLENLFDGDAAMLVDYPFAGRTWGFGLRLRRQSHRGSPPGL